MTKTVGAQAQASAVASLIEAFEKTQTQVHAAAFERRALEIVGRNFVSGAQEKHAAPRRSDDPPGGGKSPRWAPGRWPETAADGGPLQVPAAFLRFLLLSAQGRRRRHSRGLWLEGAVITGELDLDFADLSAPITIINSIFEERVRFRQADIKYLRLSGSWLKKGLDLNSSTTHNALFLDQEFRSDMMVDLRGAEVKEVADFSGGLFFRGLRPDASGSFAAAGEAGEAGDAAAPPPRAEEFALHGRGLKVGGFLRMRDRFVALGGVCLRNATVAGDLDCVGGGFHSAKAIHSLRPGLSDLLRDLLPASPQDSLAAMVASSKAFEEHLDDDALDLASATINARLLLRYPDAGIDDDEEGWPDTVLNGRIDLRAASCQTFADSAHLKRKRTVEPWKQRNPLYWLVYPIIILYRVLQSIFCASSDSYRQPRAFRLVLDRFTYVGLAEPFNARLRIDWLRRQSLADRYSEFKPQPYEQLASVLRSMGHEEDARKIAIARRAALRLSDLLSAFKSFGRRVARVDPLTIILIRVLFAGLAAAGAWSGATSWSVAAIAIFFALFLNALFGIWAVIAGCIRFVLSLVFQLTIGFGYRPFFAVLWIIFVVAVGGVWFGEAYERGRMVPGNLFAVRSAAWVRCAAPPTLRQGAPSAEMRPRQSDAARQPEETPAACFLAKSPDYPRFDQWAYSLDVFLPFFDLGQQTAWTPQPFEADDLGPRPLGTDGVSAIWDNTALKAFDDTVRDAVESFTFALHDAPGAAEQPSAGSEEVGGGAVSAGRGALPQESSPRRPPSARSWGAYAAEKARVYMWVHISLGYLLSALAIAGFTGVVKKD